MQGKNTVQSFFKLCFYCTYLTETKITSMLGTGYFLKIAKINSEQEKPVCSKRKTQFPQNTKNRQSAKINVNSRKRFVPQGKYRTIYRPFSQSSLPTEFQQATSVDNNNNNNDVFIDRTIKFYNIPYAPQIALTLIQAGKNFK